MGDELHAVAAPILLVQCLRRDRQPNTILREDVRIGIRGQVEHNDRLSLICQLFKLSESSEACRAVCKNALRPFDGLRGNPHRGNQFRKWIVRHRSIHDRHASARSPMFVHELVQHGIKNSRGRRFNPKPRDQRQLADCPRAFAPIDSHKCRARQTVLAADIPQNVRILLVLANGRE